MSAHAGKLCTCSREFTRRVIKRSLIKNWYESDQLPAIAQPSSQPQDELHHIFIGYETVIAGVFLTEIELTQLAD